MSYKEIIDNVSNIEDLDNTTILKVLEKFSKTIKDFAIEQSGLNNLVNVEFEPNENAVTYTNGVVDYLGNLKITLADNIIVNKPCSVKFNIKGSNTIVVDVDEFNNSLELHLDNSVVTTLTFAESERQKSKNLFKINNIAGYSITRNGVTATINDDYTITLNGTCTANTYFNLFNGINNGSTFSADYPKLYLDINKNYSYVLKQLSGSYSGTGTDNQIFGVSLRQTDGSGVVSGKFAELSIRVTGTNNTYVNKSGIDYLNNGYFRTTNGLTYNNFTFGLMICEGEDTDFQSWNGAIVHEKDLETATPIMAREVLFGQDTENLNNSEMTTLLEYYNYISKSPNKAFRVDIGALETSNLKTLLGNPTGFSNYTRCGLRFIGNTISTYGMIEVVAIGIYVNKLAKGYIFYSDDRTDVVTWSGWTIIN